MAKKLAFYIYSIITVVLACATVIEKKQGIDYVHHTIYGAWWFWALWGIMSIFALVHIFRSKLYRTPSTFMLHMSFILMLIGAITTALTAESGAIYLEKDKSQNCFFNENNDNIALPFKITLTDFEIEYYSGTEAEADYISSLEIEDRDGKVTTAKVSMNNIVSHQGYRFYQSEYDAYGSQLSVSRDIYGIPITYAGYILMALSFLAMLLLPSGPFRKLLRSPLLRKSAMVFAFTCASSQLFASESPRTLSAEQVELLEKIQVVYNQRVMPLTTLAHDFTLKLVGDTEYKDCTSEQFFWGWLLFPTEWENEKIYEVPQSEKSRFLKLAPESSYKDFFTAKGVYKLNHYIKNTDKKSQAALYKAIMQLNEKIQLTAGVRGGALLKIFPYPDSHGKIKWYSPVDELPEDMDKGQVIFIQNSVDLLLSSLSDPAEFEYLVSKIVGYQQKYGGESLLSDNKVRAEQWYYSFSITTILYRFNLLLGILGVIALIVFAKKPKIVKFVVRTLKCSMIHSVCLLALYIGLKWYITGRMPLVNGFDTMIFLGWCISAITLYVSRTSPLFTAMGTLMVGFTMLVATIGGMNPQITPLMPVLNSPYLTTHVCFIMFAYTLLAFTFINGILAVTIGRKNSDMMQRLTLYSRIFLMLGLAFLSAGIFIGAVWANVSWGRYWAWDPKEVWALITLMLYALPLHSRSIKLFGKARNFHIFLIFAFLAVLMTYFGVNYILGGMHSYANA